ncbi:hotdog domain-containing protein [Lysinibacter sp. HNR]|uniref:acyl-CoA thioesterase n=1 Tax=Lysinibacter sp. HNR TaxID=3031408 RepID=UPI002434CB98|nr:hotdog domain-containing protein [Lysinibacter sp. HNR]WGD37390.1 hotdog domain-containing protein [Lysinibacter sp. HNR]
MTIVNYTVRKWVKPEDLNAHGTLFGGSLLRWIDEEAAICAIFQLGNDRLVTKVVSEINFVSSAVQGDLIELNFAVVKLGRTSITLSCHVRNVFTRDDVLTISTIVFVGLDENGVPLPHGFTEVTQGTERAPVRKSRLAARSDRAE